jgi:fatty acyl-CoA reductase
MRPKHEATIQERLQALTSSTIFDSLKSEHPDSFKKLIPIAGDITSPKLGISADDEKVLHENVSIIIHSAATVKFDEVMSLSADINVGGVQRVLELAKNMKNICAIVHISTAYSNCDKKSIGEIVYPASFDPTIAIKTFSWLSDVVLRKITPDLIGSKPNTYAYTKSLAEHLVQCNKGDLPVCIVRPSIVTATVKEPVPGWVDNWQGASGILIAHGKGLLGATVANENVVIDWIPVDYLVNLIITAAWDLGTTKSPDLVVYNCCSSQLNPLTQRAIKQFSMEAYMKTPFSQTLGYPCMNLTSMPCWSKLHNFLVVLLPSVLLDTFVLFTGRTPMMMKHFMKVQNAVRVTTFFRNNDWHFTSENLVNLRDKMASVDRKMFNFNVEDIKWQAYIHNYIHGLRKYILKEDDSTIVGARRRLRRITVFYSAIRILSFLLLIGISSSTVKRWMARLVRKLIC